MTDSPFMGNARRDRRAPEAGGSLPADTVTAVPPDAQAEREWRAWLHLRTAWHESGHGLVGILLGRPPEILSTRPGEQFTGITHLATLDPPDTSGMIVGPLVRQPVAIRAWVERSIMADLGGPIGGAFCPAWAATGRLDLGDDADERRAREQAEALARQSPRHREMLVSSERSIEPLDGDEDRAWALSATFLVPDAVGHHILWLQAETRGLLAEHAGQLSTLAPALHERHVMTLAEIEAVLAGTRCVCHRWSVKQRSASIT